MRFPSLVIITSPNRHDTVRLISRSRRRSKPISTRISRECSPSFARRAGCCRRPAPLAHTETARSLRHRAAHTSLHFALCLRFAVGDAKSTVSRVPRAGGSSLPRFPLEKNIPSEDGTAQSPFLRSLLVAVEFVDRQPRNDATKLFQNALGADSQALARRGLTRPLPGSMCRRGSTCGSRLWRNRRQRTRSRYERSRYAPFPVEFSSQ